MYQVSSTVWRNMRNALWYCRSFGMHVTSMCHSKHTPSLTTIIEVDNTCIDPLTLHWNVSRCCCCVAMLLACTVAAWYTPLLDQLIS